MASKRAAWPVVMIVAGFMGLLGAGSTELRSKYEVPYEGQPLKAALSESPAIITCESDLVDRAGYYQDLKDNKTALTSALERQEKTFRWTMALEGRRAHVLQSQGAPPLWFRVVKRNPTGIILAFVEEDLNTIVISIDPTNSSFVYSTQNASPLWNRTSTFLGRCFVGP